MRFCRCLLWKWIIRGFILCCHIFCPLWIIKWNQYSCIKAPLVLHSHKIRATWKHPLKNIISLHYALKNKIDYCHSVWFRVCTREVSPRTIFPMKETAWTITLVIIFNNSTNHCQGMSSVVITTFTNSLPHN